MSRFNTQTPNGDFVVTVEEVFDDLGGERVKSFRAKALGLNIQVATSDKQSSVTSCQRLAVSRLRLKPGLNVHKKV